MDQPVNIIHWAKSLAGLSLTQSPLVSVGSCLQSSGLWIRTKARVQLGSAPPLSPPPPTHTALRVDCRPRSTELWYSLQINASQCQGSGLCRDQGGSCDACLVVQSWHQGAGIRGGPQLLEQCPVLGSVSKTHLAVQRDPWLQGFLLAPGSRDLPWDPTGLGDLAALVSLQWKEQKEIPSQVPVQCLPEAVPPWQDRRRARPTIPSGNPRDPTPNPNPQGGGWPHPWAVHCCVAATVRNQREWSLEVL